MSKNISTLKSWSRVDQGHWKCHHSIERIWLSVNVSYQHGPISYRFRDRRRFQSKIAKFFHPPLYFAPPLKGFHLELSIGAWDQKSRVMGLSGRQISLTTSSAVWIQYTNVTDRRTDRHRATAKTRLRITSRGKNGLGSIQRVSIAALLYVATAVVNWQ